MSIFAGQIPIFLTEAQKLSPHKFQLYGRR